MSLMNGEILGEDAEQRASPSRAKILVRGSNLPRGTFKARQWEEKIDYPSHHM